MPRVIRSPPKISMQTGYEVQQVHSDSELLTPASLDTLDLVSAKQTTRNKRPRIENPLRSKQQVNIDEIKDMILGLKTDQDKFIASITKDINDLKQQNEKIHNSNSSIVCSIQSLTLKHEELKLQLDGFQQLCKEQKEYITYLEGRILDLECHSRPSSVELRNVPQQANEDTENLTKIVTDTCNILDIRLNSLDIRDIYRTSSKPGTSKPLIVEFNSVHKKNIFLAATRSYNKAKPKDDKLNTEVIGIPGKKIPLYVSEFLPPQSKRLFYKAREFAKNNNFAFCWTSNGKIFLRQQQGKRYFQIKSENCLASILPAEIDSEN